MAFTLNPVLGPGLDRARGKGQGLYSNCGHWGRQSPVSPSATYRYPLLTSHITAHTYTPTLAAMQQVRDISNTIAGKVSNDWPGLAWPDLRVKLDWRLTQEPPQQAGKAYILTPMPNDVVICEWLSHR